MEKGFSQNFEEHYIVEHFKHFNWTPGYTPKFIDIGAFDFEKFSNTRQLFLEGWSGVLVEPAPERFRGIKEHYENEPRITVLDIAVGTSNEPLIFFECEDAVSTSSIEHRDKWSKAGVPYNEITVPQINVADFMEQYAKDANFISIDTEATNMEIFRAIPDWVFEQIEMLCIEHDQSMIEIAGRLAPFGFNTIHLNSENIILAK